MSKKQKKKRNKKYTGADAVSAQPNVTRVTVPDRSKAGKLWHENKKRIRRWVIFVLFVVLAYTLFF